MAAETNTIKTTDLAKVREKDFVYQFNAGIQKLIEALGVTRKIAVEEGATLKALTVTGTLQNGVVAEGDTIPLSKYSTTWTDVGTITLKKWRKGTTAEAIVKKGYDQAVGETTDKMVKDIQKGVRADLFAYLATGTGTATGTGLQAALANGWGQLQVLWEDDAVDTVFFLNPLDVSAYLGTAQVSIQTAFGMSYIENFLGLGTVFLNSSVPAGKFYATAKENVVLYYINVATSALAQSFDLTTSEDELGYIGISEYPDKDTARVMDLVMSGVTFFAERPAGVVVGTITAAGAGGTSD